MVGLHFSVDFDRVNHDALIYKLRQLSIGGPFLNILVENYKLKTLLYLFKPTVHEEQKQSKIKLSSGSYNFKVRFSQ